MNSKKIKALLLVIIFFLYNLGPAFSVIGWKKIYSYTEESVNMPGKIETVYAQEASNFNIQKKISYFKKTGKSSFKGGKDLFVFKIKRNTSNDQNYKFLINVNGTQKEILSDDDGDERMIKDEYVYSEPVFLKKSATLTYEIRSDNKEDLALDMKLIGIDSSAYTEKLTVNTEETVNAEEKGIISRSDWGADETLRYEDNPKWVAIYKQIEENSKKPKSAWQIKQEQKITDIRNYLAVNFPLEDTPVSTIRHEAGHDLVWPIEKTKRVEKIFVHHTAEFLDNDTRDDATIVRGIYYYHSITKGWGDIGYNYLVGRDGKIYEGRAGGDYAVAAHNLWNNKSTAGISVMGNFESGQIGDIQKNGVDAAVGLIAKKYGIDLNKTTLSHKECSDSTVCLLKDFNTPNLSGHKDAGTTSCPGTNLYSLLQDFRTDGKIYSSGLTYIENNNIEVDNSGLPKGPNIKVKLSYSGETIQVQSYTPESMKIEIGGRSGYVKLKYLNFELRPDNKIALVIGRKSLKVSTLKISSTVLEIPSWERKPTWDKTGKINDNKFRGSLILSNDNGKLLVVNELPLEDYLKGIAEISNEENEQKAKTILVSARSYALWYTNPNNRKFPGKSYDGSDNPDEFQKYLGYSFELRGANIGRYVDDTNGMVIKYNGNLIKPWYFNQSDGNTKSYKEYCEKRKTDGSLPSTQICEEIPYLKSVADPAGASEGGLKGHGVGISGAGAKVLALEGKKYDEIIRYFLSGVTVEKTSY